MIDNGDIIFCNDGVLRVHLNDESPLVDLASFQNMTETEDLLFMSSWWENTVHFEDGLTVAKFLMCLEPWADFWTTITHKDIRAYITESRKPTLVEDTDEKWYAVLGYYTEISPELKYPKRDMDQYASFSDFFMDRTPPTILPFWGLDSHYKLNGHVVGQDEHYAIDYNPLNEMANWPLYLSKYHILFPNNYFVEEYGEEGMKNLIDVNAVGIRHAGNEERQHPYVVGTKYHRMREVIEAFFWWFPTNPTRRDAFNEEMKERLAEIKEHLPEASTEAQEGDTVETDTEEPKLKIVVADGAFDGIAEQWSKEKDFFDKAIRFSSEAKVSRLRVGGYRTAKLPEKRISKWVVKDEDLYE